MFCFYCCCSCLFSSNLYLDTIHNGQVKQLSGEKLNPDLYCFSDFHGINISTMVHLKLAAYTIPKYFTIGSHKPIRSKQSISLVHSRMWARTEAWSNILDLEPPARHIRSQLEAWNSILALHTLHTSIKPLSQFSHQQIRKKFLDLFTSWG